jgi:hypothetical protein
MARKIVGRRIKQSLSHGPLGENPRAWLVDLTEGLTWTVEAVAGMNHITIKSA